MIRIPFMARFHEPIRSGKKTMTTRMTARYGEPGEIVQGPGCLLRILDKRFVQLGDVARHHFEEEGCETEEEFRAIWRGIHPILGDDSKLGVWLYRFEVAADGR